LLVFWLVEIQSVMAVFVKCFPYNVVLGALGLSIALVSKLLIIFCSALLTNDYFGADSRCIRTSGLRMLLYFEKRMWIPVLLRNPVNGKNNHPLLLGWQCVRLARHRLYQGRIGIDLVACQIRSLLLMTASVQHIMPLRLWMVMEIEDRASGKIDRPFSTGLGNKPLILFLQDGTFLQNNKICTSSIPYSPGFW
jgi:hypothetical protein